MKKKDICIAICYGNVKRGTREELMDFFFRGMLASEGSEHERYSNIYYGLYDGYSHVTDEGEYTNKKI